MEPRSLVLALESSCDETAAAIIADGRRIVSSITASQAALHEKYGGVVPEIASRKHLENLIPTLREALAQARLKLSDLTLVAATAGPGLVGTLLVGLSAAKALAWILDKPFVGVNHLQGHIYANFLSEPVPEFPLVCLVVSGGHTDLIYMAGHGQMELMGRTRDDAAGEAFDKVARLLGLPYPGGAALERLARSGSAEAIPLPRAWLEGTFDFSFSGLKTAVLQVLRGANPPDRADLAASFQRAVVDVLAAKAVRAAEQRQVQQLLLAGGVAANSALRAAVVERAAALGIQVRFPPPVLCTDNAAMIGAAAYYLSVSGRQDGLDRNVNPNLGILE